MNEPATRFVQTVTLDPPTLANNTADADRLAGALKQRLGIPDLDLEIGLPLMHRLPEKLRQWHYRVRCTIFKEQHRCHLIEIDAPEAESAPLGLAIDLGTSRVVLRLLDLATGKPITEKAITNPQTEVGPDILTRIHHCDRPGGLTQLNRLIVDTLNKTIAAACTSAARQPEEIRLTALAGNTAMTHLFLGLNPRWIIREPYIPVVNRPGSRKAASVGLQVHPNGRVFVFPNIGSYFGGDLIAGILYAGLHEREETGILVDVGTNAEVVLGNRNWLIACAGAAGPALEGGVTRMGMMAGPGVIDRIRIDGTNGQFNIRTIDDLPPCGICGSGLIDLAAQLFTTGMIDFRGRFVSQKCAGQLETIDGLTHLVVVPGPDSATGSDLTISQADLDSLIRSKAAMYTILETLTNTVGIDLQALATFFVAGTFGAFIQPRSAVCIGMIPDLPSGTYKALGNSSLGGAALALSAMEHMDAIDRIKDQITYLELNVNQEFMNRFSAARFLPHTDRSRFPSVATHNQ